MCQHDVCAHVWVYECSTVTLRLCMYAYVCCMQLISEV